MIINKIIRPSVLLVVVVFQLCCAWVHLYSCCVLVVLVFLALTACMCTGITVLCKPI